MAQSPEYPDLKWVEPASWRDANRTSVQVVVIHDTEGSSHGESAEDGAAYDARRTDGTSTHYFHDSNSTVQCVRTNDIAYTARSNGNRIGIHHELCARASFKSSDWLDPDYGNKMLLRAAKQVARDCKKWGIPVRKLSAGSVASGVKGICGHADITAAFPADNGTHTDPGPNFPWATFLKYVQDELDTLNGKVADVTKAEVLEVLRSKEGQDALGDAIVAAFNRAATVRESAETEGPKSVIEALRDAGVAKQFITYKRGPMMDAVVAELKPAPPAS
jgi:N-acetyl-anhydromuramyl-L-alanine amidase AmpD